MSRRVGRRKVFGALVAAVLALSCQPTPPAAAGPATPPEPHVKELRVNKVVKVAKPTAQAAGSVITDRSGTLVVREGVHADTLTTLAAQDDLASIEYDTTSREVTAVGSAPHDVVMTVAPGAAGVDVQLMMRPSLLSLDSRHPRFTELMKALRDAQAAKKAVSVGVLPGSGRIEDVRPD